MSLWLRAESDGKAICLALAMWNRLDVKEAETTNNPPSG
jgi:hypothetical protein